MKIRHVFCIHNVTQAEVDDITKVIAKLALDIYFKSTDDENDKVLYDSIERLARPKSEMYNIGFYENRLKRYLIEIFKENCKNEFVEKIQYR